jgi:hypothetical protein
VTLEARKGINGYALKCRKRTRRRRSSPFWKCVEKSAFCYSD